MIRKNTVSIILALCAIVYLAGMFLIPLMDVDAAQYASISREMLERNSWLQFYDLGRDYLDKPPMLFWLSGLSMKIFGVHDWAYRLPSFLFAWLAVYSTYRLALLFYKKDIALLSAMVLATSQAMFLIMHDVRTDTMLMGWVIFSIWRLAEWYQYKKWADFFLAFLGIAGGMMTKGPIALMVPAFALVPHFILRREWKQFFRWEYLLGLVIIAIALIPMSIGLYQQFDLHPGKLINGDPIQSGLRFYYWTQSFGRYTGENHFKEMSDFTFLLQNMLWSFLPWIIFFLIGLLFDIIELIKNRGKLSHQQEWMTAGGFIITYCILGRSQAQLPHYIFIVFPLAAIITAKFLYRLYYSKELHILGKILSGCHIFIFTLLWLLVIVLMAYPFASIPKFVSGLAGLSLMFMLAMLFTKKERMPAILRISFFTIIGVNFFLNMAFYPTLLKFQMGSNAAGFINKLGISKDKVKMYGADFGHSFHFYGQHIFPLILIDSLKPGDIVVAPKDSLASLQHHFAKTKVLYNGWSYGVTQLSLPFLNPETREKELGRYVIVDLNK
jgi:4-amino-4-deoxy-L-arabinose transferase-like glycosyltransferase